MPYALEPWLREHCNQTHQVLEDMRRAITFLRKNGIVHFDTNVDNMLSDGTHAYLTDFGLVLDTQFTLTDAEAVFLKQHRDYDYGEIIGSVGILLYSTYDSLSENDKQQVMGKYGIAEGMHPAELTAILLNHIEDVMADGSIKLDKRYVATIVKYRSIMRLFVDFIVSMSKKNQKDTRFPHATLARLLKETGFLSGSL